MAQKTVIIDIVRRFDRRLSRFVRDGLSGQQKHLYEFYTTSKAPENIADAQKAVGLKGNTFSVVKSQMELSVMALLGEYQLRDKPPARLEALRELADGYRSMGNEEKALATYLKAVNMAEEMEDYPTALGLLATIRTYFKGLPGLPALERSLALSDRQVEVALCLQAMMAAEGIKPLRGNERIERAEKELQLLGNFVLPISKKATLYLLRAKVICLGIMRQLEDCLTLVNFGREVVAQHAVLLHDPTLCDTAVRLSIVGAGIMLDHHAAESAIAQLESFEAVVEMQGIAVPNAIKILHHQSKIAFFLERKNEQSLYKAIDDAWGFTGTTAINSQRNVAQMAFYISVTLVELENYHMAEVWLLRLRSFQSGKGPDIFQLMGSILELVCAASLYEFERIDNLITRAKRQFKRDQVPDPFPRIVLSAFRIVRKGTGQKRAAFLEMATALREIRSDERFRLCFEAFDLITWAENQAKLALE